MDPAAMATPPHSPRFRVLSTPLRRSMADLLDQLTALMAEESLDREDGAEPSVPASKLPALIDAFEERRGVQLLTEGEKPLLAQFAESMGSMPITRDQLVSIIQTMGASTTPAGPPSDSVDDAAPPSAVTPLMLAPDNVDGLLDGSPAPRRRPSSAQSTNRLVSTTTPPASPSRLTKRRSLLSILAHSPSSPGGAQSDLSSILVARGGTYLGVPLDGPLGVGFNAEGEADILRVATKGLGTREKEIIDVLGDKTFPQIRAIDRAYQSRYDKTLVQLINSEKSLRGNIEYALRGLVLGPLDFDVWLLNKALEGSVRNDALLIDLLIARPPSALALLKAAYQRKAPSSTALSPSPVKSNAKSLEATILGGYSSNAKLKKAWEIALQGKWEDQGDAGEGEGGGAGGRTEQQRSQLLKEDVDQLKVALRKGGNSDPVIKILLARSPAHIHSIVVEYRKNSPTSLSKAVKQVFIGPLVKMLLFAIENSKKDKDRPGVWRDAKLLEKTMEGVGTRNEALSWRLLRLHWDRPRFQLVQAAYRQKYSKPLLDRVAGETSGTFRDLLRVIISSSTLPAPSDTLEDHSISSATVTCDTAAPSDVDMDDASSIKSVDQPSLLEGDGELSNPPSPRSPPSVPYNDQGDQEDQLFTPQASSSFQFEEALDPTSPPHTPTLPADLSASTSSIDSTTSTSSKGHKLSSSLSFRRRSTPLESLGHRPTSSSGGSVDKSHSSLRHSRPVAPGRRRQSQDPAPARADSEEPISPSGSRSSSPMLARSPTPSGSRRISGPSSSFAALSETDALSGSAGSDRAGALSIGQDETSDTLRSPASSSQVPLLDPTSPFSSIDTTSYHATPLSPERDGDISPSTSSFAAFDTSRPSFTNSYDPETPERFTSSQMGRQGSTASSSSMNSLTGGNRLFFGEGSGNDGGFRPESLFDSPMGKAEANEQYQNLIRHASELARKLKDAELRLETSANSYEQDHHELEGRLEEARAELQIKRREEKELRGVEKQHLAQISSLEGDIAKLTKSLERSREAYETMKRNYTAQCDEAEKLRNLVAETRRENRAAEEAAHVHGLQVQQFERDRDILQAAINKLEGDLAGARRAQDSLDDQKQENLLLKETIDRLRFDLDEMRSATRNKSGFLDGSATGSAPGVTASMSKSLGKELARRLAASGPDEDDDELETDEETEREDEVDDIIVTTHRRIKKKRALKSSPSEPTVTHVEETTVVVDEGVQTDAVVTREMDIQTDLPALVFAPTTDAQVDAVPLEPSASSKSPRGLAQELEVDLDAFQRFVDAQKNGDASASPSPSPPTLLQSPGVIHIGAGARRAGRWASRMSSRAAVQGPALLVSVFPESAKPYVAQILESSMTFFLYTATIYLAGFITGSRFFPINHHHHFAPFQVSFSQGDLSHNTMGSWNDGLVGGGMAREGVQGFIESLVWSGVSSVRRMPV